MKVTMLYFSFPELTHLITASSGTKEVNEPGVLLGDLEAYFI